MPTCAGTPVHTSQTLEPDIAKRWGVDGGDDPRLFAADADAHLEPSPTFLEDERG